MSFGVLGEYVKSLFASSPCTHRFFPCILQIRLNTFRVFEDAANNPNLPFSPYMLKYFPRILQIRLETFRAFRVLRKNEEYAERNFHFQHCPGTLKGQCLEKIKGVICLRRVNSL